jgi:aspartokinase
VVVRNSHRPASAGTIVSAARSHAGLVIAGLACRPGAIDGKAGDLATVTVVGDGLAANPGLATDASRALDGIRAHFISQQAGSRTLSFVVDATHAQRAMVRLHDYFFDAARGRAVQQSSAVQA